MIALVSALSMVSAVAFASHGMAATVDTTDWIGAAQPFPYAGQEGRPAWSWDRGPGFASRSINGATGTLHSPDAIDGDFRFSGVFSSVEWLNNSGLPYRDNDPLGIVFGWQDVDNHYRLGISGGNHKGFVFDRGSSSEKGLVLIREQDGVDKVLFNRPNIIYDVNRSYSFEVGRKGDEIFFSIMGDFHNDKAENGADIDSDVLISFQVTDLTFQQGAFGVYSVSTPGSFEDLRLVTTPLPPTVLMLVSAFCLIGFRRVWSG